MSIQIGLKQWRERFGSPSVLLSVLAHFVVLLLLVLDAMGLFGTVAAPEQPQVIEVTLVPQAPPQAAAPPPQAAPEPPPPPPPPPEPETAPEEAAPPPPMPMARPEPPPMAPPAKPMLEAGKLGKESKQGNDKDTAGPQQAAAKESAKHTWLDDVGDGPPRQNLPIAANAQTIQMGQGGKHSDGGGNVGPTTQSGISCWLKSCAPGTTAPITAGRLMMWWSCAWWSCPTAIWRRPSIPATPSCLRVPSPITNPCRPMIPGGFCWKACTPCCASPSL